MKRTILVFVFLSLPLSLYGQTLNWSDPYVLDGQTPDDYRLAAGSALFRFFVEQVSMMPPLWDILVERSTDAGQTWAVERIETMAVLAVRTLAATTDGDTVYLAARVKSGLSTECWKAPFLWRTTDRGQTWQRIGGISALMPPCDQNTFCGEIGLYAREGRLVIAFNGPHMEGPEHCVPQRAGVWVAASPDGGYTWSVYYVSDNTPGFEGTFQDLRPAGNGFYVFWEEGIPFGRERRVQYAEWGKP